MYYSFFLHHWVSSFLGRKVMIPLCFQFHHPQGTNAEEEMRRGVGQINTGIQLTGPKYSVSWPAYV